LGGVANEIIRFAAAIHAQSCSQACDTIESSLKNTGLVLHPVSATSVA
jgi:hypothetical protein